MGMDQLSVWTEHNIGNCQLGASLTLPSKAVFKGYPHSTSLSGKSAMTLIK